MKTLLFCYLIVSACHGADLIPKLPAVVTNKSDTVTSFFLLTNVVNNVSTTEKVYIKLFKQKATTSVDQGYFGDGPSTNTYIHHPQFICEFSFERPSTNKSGLSFEEWQSMQPPVPPP